VNVGGHREGGSAFRLTQNVQLLPSTHHPDAPRLQRRRRLNLAEPHRAGRCPTSEYNGFHRLLTLEHHTNAMPHPTFGKRQSASTTGMERRRSDRWRTSVLGRIILGSRQIAKCSIVEMSSTGAVLTVASMRGIPDSFRLEDDSGRRRTLRVIRRGGSRVAVKFD